jgi:hypothetical protein
LSNPGAAAVSQLASAQIIPFPAKPPADNGAARLTQALAALDAALAEQRTSIAAWRGSLVALRDSTSALGASLVRYQSSLGALGADVAALNGQARTLKRWADAALVHPLG